MKEGRQSERTILVAGTPFIKRIDVEVALGLREYGVDSVFYTRRGIKTVKKAVFRDERAPAFRRADVLRFGSLLKKLRPDHVELYISSPYSVIPFYAVITKAHHIPLVVWCRGGEIYYWNTKHNFFRRMVVRLSFRLADFLLVKEAYMPREILRLGLAKSEKIIEMPNRIPVYPDFSAKRPSPVVLFLNSPKPWRHVELLVETIPRVAASVPEVRYLFVGARTQQEAEYINTHVRRVGADAWVEVHPYSPDVRKFYERASLFALPAELVYINHSLLEAMERAVPPLVADVDPQVGRIVEHNISGLVLPLNVEDWTRAIIELLQDETRRQRLALAARRKVERDFSLDDKIAKLIHFYSSVLWPA